MKVKVKEMRDPIDRTSPSPKQKIISLFDECAEALLTTSDEYFKEELLDLGDYYMKLSKKCLNASDYLKNLR